MWSLGRHELTEIDIKFLNALKKTRRLWSNDKEFSKIVGKMQSGKNLKAREFDIVQSYLRKSCRY